MTNVPPPLPQPGYDPRQPGYGAPQPGYGPPTPAQQYAAPVPQPPAQQFAPPPLPNPEAMPAPPPLGEGGDHAALHRTEITRTYPCRACGAQLVFDPSQGRLRCPSCGNTVDVAAAAGVIRKHDLRQATAALRAAGTPVTLEKEVVCQACGGRTTFTGTLTATRCPYCATPIQRDDLKDVPGRLPIDGVLPFRVDEKAAREQIEKWINSRWFTPTEFKSYREIGSFESIYLAYFSYDAHVTADYAGRRGEDYQVRIRDGDRERTETRTRWYPVSGRVQQAFNDVAAWANHGLDESRVHQLEPWPLHEAVPYSPEYLAGHLGRTYDLDADETFGARVRGSLEHQVEQTIRRDIGGDRQDIDHRDIRFDAISFAHLLLPVWLLTVTYQGRPYQVIMNGVTGEVQGARPWSKVKLVLFIAAILLVVAVIVAVVQVLQ